MYTSSKTNYFYHKVKIIHTYLRREPRFPQGAYGAQGGALRTTVGGSRLRASLADPAGGSILANPPLICKGSYIPFESGFGGIVLRKITTPFHQLS